MLQAERVPEVFRNVDSAHEREQGIQQIGKDESCRQQDTDKPQRYPRTERTGRDGSLAGAGVDGVLLAVAQVVDYVDGTGEHAEQHEPCYCFEYVSRVGELEREY